MDIFLTRDPRWWLWERYTIINTKIYGRRLIDEKSIKAFGFDDTETDAGAFNGSIELFKNALKHLLDAVRGSLPLRNDHISGWSSALNGKRDRMKIQTFRPHRVNSHRILERCALNGVEWSAHECPALIAYAAPVLRARTKLGQGEILTS
ncbi:hypothetical protein AVEN_64255-1 [Araneus ventricosus]|uniref:Uncharacterized protein n=1 Tax=Araneus ventricosus TaxID=182803 RepID=A0A4Y2SEF2_ARAVE|nr:hypothetical protein AVEN_64255-1 [Araneus ventricosus]